MVNGKTVRSKFYVYINFLFVITEILIIIIIVDTVELKRKRQKFGGEASNHLLKNMHTHQEHNFRHDSSKCCTQFFNAQFLLNMVHGYYT